MAKSVERLMSVLLSMKRSGEDLNHQLKTVQGKNIKTSRFGAELDDELDAFFRSVLCSDYRVALDLDTFYLSCSPESHVTFDYSVEGEARTVYLDFNKVKHIQEPLHGEFIVPFYTEEQGYIRTTDKKPLSNSLYFIMRDANADKPTEDEPAIETIEEAIDKLKESMESNQTKWSVASFIEAKLQEKHMSKSELSDETNIKYKTLISKFKMNTITAEELIRIAIAMDLDMNEIKYAYQESSKIQQHTDGETVEYIANLVKSGFSGGILPTWELVLPQKQLYPLSPSERNLVAKEIERGNRKGFLSGDYPREWTLVYEPVAENESNSK